MTAKKLLGIGKQTFKCFGEDKAMRLASSLAYYAIFSIGPLMFIMLIIAGAIFGEDTVKQTLHQQISSMMGEKAGSTIESMMNARKIGGSAVTTIIGMVTLVFGATGVFGELQDASEHDLGRESQTERRNLDLFAQSVFVDEHGAWSGFLAPDFNGVDHGGVGGIK